jgi:hypothetical protein
MPEDEEEEHEENGNGVSSFITKKNLLIWQ